MTINIDQDELCDFCKSYNDSNMSMCEGCDCEKMNGMYLDEHGITEENPDKKTFEMLRVGDNVYRIDLELIIPNIETLKINSLSQMNDDYFRIHYNSDSVYIKEKDVSVYKNLSVYKKDAYKELERVCTDRIIQLSKVVGSIE